jgi:SAM-dependent methyltransferase
MYKTGGEEANPPSHFAASSNPEEWTMSPLFPLEALARETEHPQFHCHSAYDRDAPVKWYLDAPSVDLRWELTGRSPDDLHRPSPALEGLEAGRLLLARLDQSLAAESQIPRPRALELGAGDGRDSIFLAERGFHVTGVDVHEKPVRRARAKARQRGLQTLAHFAVFDALSLPAPSEPVTFVYDNTVYCNLRIEYLDRVLALLERVTTPGLTFYMLNCGSDKGASIVPNHPRLRLSDIERELGGLFEILSAYDGIYDMIPSPNWPEYERAHRGVRSHTIVFRRRAG